MKTLILGKNSKIFKNLKLGIKKENLILFDRKDLDLLFNNQKKEIIDKLKNVKIIINFIGEYKDKTKMFDSNFYFLKKLFNILDKNNKNFTFIHFSSLGVYGLYNRITKHNQLNEKSKLKSINYYQKTKIMAENFLNSKKKNHSIIIIRLSSIYEFNWKLRFIEMMLNNKFINFFFYKTFADGIYNFIFLKDLNLLMKKMISTKLNKSKIYNIVGNYKIDKKFYSLNIKFFKKNKIINNKISIDNYLIKKKFKIINFKSNKIYIHSS